MKIDALRQLVASQGGLVVESRALRGALSAAVAKGELVRVMPRVYASPPILDSVVGRCSALMLGDPNAIVTGRAAANLLWWPELPVPVVVAVRHGTHRQVPGFQWSERVVHPDRVIEVQGLRLTDPAVTVLDLIPELGGAAVDEALRRGVVRLNDLEAALSDFRCRRGNALRRRVLVDSRDEPWSEAERAFHRILRGLRLPWGHETNVRVALGTTYAYLDVALPKLMLAFEVDGREFHAGATPFVRDRVRDVTLELAGWRVHRFAAATVTDEPDWVAASVRQLAHARAVSLGLEVLASWAA